LNSTLLSALIIGVKEKESIYQFFHGLPDFIKESSIRLPREEDAPPEGTPPSGPARQADENEEFLDAMKDVKRIAPAKVRVPGTSRGKGLAPKPCLNREMDEMLRDERVLNVINLPEYMEGYVDDLNPIIMEKLRNNEFSIQKVLDLHGLSTNDALDAFSSFMAEAVQSHLRCVKVIHGRGLKSRKGPVLKERLKEWIVRAMHRKWVVAFASSKMPAGGPGATIILLRAKARKKRLHIIG